MMMTYNHFNHSPGFSGLAISHKKVVIEFYNLTDF